jgi:HD superfamily phosphodiesterase
MSDTAEIDLGECFADPRLARLLAAVRKRYATADLIAHGMEHIERVLVNAVVIAKTEDCRMDIVIAAVLLHDIGFLESDDPGEHNVTGARLCGAWLDGWTEADTAQVAECIYRHKGVNEHWRTAPETIEQKIVCDADLLEKVGYIGLVQGVRVFVEIGAKHNPALNTLPAVARVLTKMRTVTFYTRTGRELAERRGGVLVRVEAMEKALAEESFYAPALRQLRDLAGEKA